MMRTIDFPLDLLDAAFYGHTVDGLPLIERLDGGSTIGAWLRLWGITPGVSHPLGGLPRRHGAGSAPCWLYSL